MIVIEQRRRHRGRDNRLLLRFQRQPVRQDDVAAYILDGGNVVLEIEAGAVTAKYTRAMGLVHSVIGGASGYYLYNAHGDVVQLADASGAVVRYYEYDAFGVEKKPDDADTTPFRYCGEYFDAETGTYYLRARYYDPCTSRMLSTDPHWHPGDMIYGDNPRKKRC